MAGTLSSSVSPLNGVGEGSSEKGRRGPNRNNMEYDLFGSEDEGQGSASAAPSNVTEQRNTPDPVTNTTDEDESRLQKAVSTPHTPTREEYEVIDSPTTRTVTGVRTVCGQSAKIHHILGTR